MEYTEIKIYTSSAGTQAVTALLSDRGYEGFVIEDGADIEELLQEKEHYWWDYVDESVLAMRDNEPNVMLYIEKNEETDIKIQEIETALTELKEADRGADDFGRLAVETRIVCDGDWKDKWKEYFKPTHITDRIVVKPTWESYIAEKPGEIVIEIDPGMAFGTGAHPTTSMCVSLLGKYIGEKKTVLDVGCGSGILSIAAALSGASKVMAVDIDPLAVQVTSENAALNRVQNKITVWQGDLTKGLSVKTDIVLANLMAELVMLLCADVKRHMEPGGIFISSGILTEKREIVEQTLHQNGFVILEALEEDGWCALAATTDCQFSAE